MKAGRIYNRASNSSDSEDEFLWPGIVFESIRFKFPYQKNKITDAEMFRTRSLDEIMALAIKSVDNTEKTRSRIKNVQGRDSSDIRMGIFLTRRALHFQASRHGPVVAAAD